MSNNKMDHLFELSNILGETTKRKNLPLQKQKEANRIEE